MRKLGTGDHPPSAQRNTLLTWIAAFALVASFPAHAGSLSVSPLRLTFSNTAGIIALTVENTGREEALVQTETFAWNQVGGEHSLSPTDDVVAVPPVFRLAPNAQQRVRVGLTRAFTEKQEQTFRLTVTEVPTAVASGTVAVTVRHSLPIFVQPSTPISPNLTVKVVVSTGIEIANDGSQHLRIHRWRLRDSNGTIVAEDSGPGYLLNGARLLLAGSRESLAKVGQRLMRPAVFEADIDARTLKIAVGE